MSAVLRIPARVDAEAVALALGVSRETVLRAHRRGDLPSGVLLGRSVTFDGNCVARWLQERGVGNVEAVDSITGG